MLEIVLEGIAVDEVGDETDVDALDDATDVDIGSAYASNWASDWASDYFEI